MLARLKRPRGGLVTLVRAVEPLAVPTTRLVPGRAHSVLLRELRAVNTATRREAARQLEWDERQLRRAGWKTRASIVTGHPVRAILTTARKAEADLLVTGARGIGGLTGLLLGSVAEGVLDRSPISVLIVR
jgi:nucleotide-binding universal stress UspA family protein